MFRFLTLSCVVALVFVGLLGPQRATAEGKPPVGWGAQLNPTGQIPDQGFLAIYIDRRDPYRVVFKETVASIAIKYAWDEFHGIDSPDFAGYWVGRLKFDTATIKDIAVSQSWARSRIFIDGKLIGTQARDGASIRHEFSAGEHVIEVEYINNWHTVEFKVTLQDPVPVLTRAEIAAEFARAGASDADLYYVGLYESGSRDTSVSVTLPETGRSIVLWLDSYEAIDWNVISTDKVAAVVVSAFTEGSRVIGVQPERMFRMKGWMGVHSETRRCSCRTMFHCEDKYDMADVAAAAKAMTGRPLTGYAASYAATNVSMTLYDTAAAARIAAAEARTLADAKACQERATPDFDTLFETPKEQPQETP